MDLIKQDEKLGRFTSSLHIWHTKAMTALAEYGARCLYKTTTVNLSRSGFDLTGDFIRFRRRSGL